MEATKNEIATVQAQLEASVGVSAEAVQRYHRLSEQVSDEVRFMLTVAQREEGGGCEIAKGSGQAQAQD